MSGFPRTEVGGVSLPRMLIGTNWFLGYSHTSASKSSFIVSYQSPKRIADIMEVFFSYGIDATIGRVTNPTFAEAVKDVQERTGKKMTVIDTPGLPIVPGGLDIDETARILDESASLGATFCMPHQSTTDKLLDMTTRTFRDMDKVCAMIRERGMVPGLSTHSPQVPVCADESGLDVETYIQIYNAAGFMMSLEVDWVHRIILKSAKPVMTIKPLGAGRLLPLVGLAFVWSTLRDKDMVTIGTMTPDEAKEDIELSLSILERRAPEVELQRTRSKDSVDKVNK